MFHDSDHHEDIPYKGHRRLRPDGLCTRCFFYREINGREACDAYEKWLIEPAITRAECPMFICANHNEEPPHEGEPDIIIGVDPCTGLVYGTDRPIAHAEPPRRLRTLTQHQYQNHQG